MCLGPRSGAATLKTVGKLAPVPGYASMPTPALLVLSGASPRSEQARKRRVGLLSPRWPGIHQKAVLIMCRSQTMRSVGLTWILISAGLLPGPMFPVQPTDWPPLPMVARPKLAETPTAITPEGSTSLMLTVSVMPALVKVRT